MSEVRAAKAKGQFQPPKHPLRALHNAALKQKRPLALRPGEDTGVSVGQLFLSVLGGQFCTTRPYWIAELDGNEARTPVATCSTPTWDADFSFTVHDPSSDLRLFLFDDELAENERPIGRVILPLAHLCRGLPLPRPTGPRRMLLRVMPVGPQHSNSLLARYEEATPHVPGSGMVRPAHELGLLEIVVHLRFDGLAAGGLGMLAAYTAAAPPGAVEERDGDDGGTPRGEEESVRSKMQPRILRLNALRLQRCLRRPPLLATPWCLMLPAVLYFSCFGAPAPLLPWLFLALAVANGLLDFAERQKWVEGMIFFEAEVGEADMPRNPLAKLRMLGSLLEKLQNALGALSERLEKSRNLLNWADPTITTVAIVLLSACCAGVSVALALLPLNVLAFCSGTLVLAPFLVDAALQLLPPAWRDGLAERTAQDAVACGVGAGSPGTQARRGGSDGGARAAGGEGATPPGGKKASAGRQRSSALLMLRRVLTRAPDSRDLAHRFFATREQIVEEELLVGEGAGAAALPCRSGRSGGSGAERAAGYHQLHD